MRVTLKQIAEEANTSLATTSLILNNKPVRVSESTKQNVLAVAKKYNYRPNKIAQGLVTKKTMTVGFVIPDISNTFFAETAKYIDLELTKHGYNLILCNTNDSVVSQVKSIDNLLSRGVDALVICLAQESLDGDDFVSQIKSLDIPCVAFDRWSGDIPCSMVSIDNKLGAILATEHLVSLGHKQIGCITGALSSVSAQQRFDGFKEVLEKYNLEVNPNLVFEGDYHSESGFVGGKKLIENGATAIFACNDLMAYGVMRASKEANLSIPKDLSVVGFDDLFFSATTEVPLTTIRQPIDLLATDVANKVLKLLKGKAEHQNTIIAPSLVVRGSTTRRQ